MTVQSDTTAPARSYSWSDLDIELRCWRELGLRAQFWWRDDDASSACDALQKLTTITGKYNVPLALAVVPAKVSPSLTSVLASQPHVCVLQHGYDHISHATGTDKKSEFGVHRDMSVRLTELASGKEKLQSLFGRRFIPVFVPPWNRYDTALLPLLDGVGLVGISAMWARTFHDPAPLQVNTHIDPIAWRDDRDFVGLSVALEQLVSHLRLKREYVAFRGEPTGLLTHHLDHTEPVWDFCQELVQRLTASDVVEWCSAAKIWGADSACILA